MRRFTDGTSRDWSLFHLSTLQPSVVEGEPSRLLAGRRLIPADERRYLQAMASDRRRQSIPRPVVKAAGFALPAMAAGLLALGVAFPTRTSEASSIEPAIGSLLIVNGTEGIGLRVREQPGLNGRRLATLPDGAAVRVTGAAEHANGFTWVPVEDPTGRYPKGWSATDWLFAVAPSQERLLDDGAPQQSQQAAQAPVAAQQAPAPVEAISITARCTGYNGAEYGDPWGGVTASGTKVHWGTVAVDPNVIPLGSKLRIEGFDTIFVAEDTGSAIKGNRVDVWFPSVGEALNFGVRTLQVTVLQ